MLSSRLFPRWSPHFLCLMNSSDAADASFLYSNLIKYFLTCASFENWRDSTLYYSRVLDGLDVMYKPLPSDLFFISGSVYFAWLCQCIWIQRKHSDEAPLSKQLMDETPVYQQETKLIQELPLRLSESVENCKNSFEEVLLAMQRFASGGKLSNSKMLSTMSEISSQLFATLEASFAVKMDGERSCTGNYASIHEQQKLFHEKVNNIITSLELSESSSTEGQERSPLCTCEHKGSDLGGETAYSMEVLNERYESLEKEFLLLKDERDSLLQMFSKLSEKHEMVSSQKENALKDLNTEVQRRKNLEGEVKQFTAAFACRQKSLMAFHSDFKTRIEKLRGQTSISVPKTLGCQD